MKRRIKKAKPCPFCGGNEIYYVQADGQFIGCRPCNSLIGDDRSKAKLLERWNARAIQGVEINEENWRMASALAAARYDSGWLHYTHQSHWFELAEMKSICGEVGRHGGIPDFQSPRMPCRFCEAKLNKQGKKRK